MTHEYQNLKKAIKYQNEGKYFQSVFHYMQIPLDVAEQGLDSIKTIASKNPQYREVSEFIEDLYKKNGYDCLKTALKSKSAPTFEKAAFHFTKAKCAVGLLAIVLNSSNGVSPAVTDTLNRWSN